MPSLRNLENKWVVTDGPTFVTAPKSAEIERTALDFRKFFLIENFCFEKFHNYSRDLANSSLHRKFYTEKL